MKGILAIFKKELARFFGDKRTVITILMPGLLIYIIYSFMGSTVMSDISTEADFLPVVAVNQVPASLEPVLSQLDLVQVNDREEAEAFLSEENAHVAILFPTDFDAAVAAYDMDQGLAPQIELLYDASSSDSYTAYTMLAAALDGYEASLVNKFDILAQDLASEDSTTAQVFSMMLPMLLMMFLHSGCMAVAPESIAGEKERGTIATLLITPVARGHIALGKIMALSLIATISATSSALGTILSLPKLMGTELGGNIYGIREYALLACVLLSTVLLMVTLISLISALAKSVKEATTMSLPLMILVMFMGVMAMSGPSAGGSAQFLIPLYNSVQAMTRIFTFSNATLPTVITVISNLAYAGVGVWGLTALFRSEKILSTT